MEMRSRWDRDGMKWSEEEWSGVEWGVSECVNRSADSDGEMSEWRILFTYPELCLGSNRLSLRAGEWVGWGDAVWCGVAWLIEWVDGFPFEWADVRWTDQRNHDNNQLASININSNLRVFDGAMDDSAILVVFVNAWHPPTKGLEAEHSPFDRTGRYYQQMGIKQNHKGLSSTKMLKVFSLRSIWLGGLFDSVRRSFGVYPLPSFEHFWDQDDIAIKVCPIHQTLVYMVSFLLSCLDLFDSMVKLSLPRWLEFVSCENRNERK